MTLQSVCERFLWLLLLLPSVQEEETLKKSKPWRGSSKKLECLFFSLDPETRSHTHPLFFNTSLSKLCLVMHTPKERPIQNMCKTHGKCRKSPRSPCKLHAMLHKGEAERQLFSPKLLCSLPPRLGLHAIRRQRLDLGLA